MAFYCDYGASSELEPSCMSYTLRLCARSIPVLKKKFELIELPLREVLTTK